MGSLPRPGLGKNVGRAVDVGPRSTRDPRETVWGSPDQTSLNLMVSPGCTWNSSGKYSSAARGTEPLVASTETENVWGPARAGAGAGFDGSVTDGFDEVQATTRLPDVAATSTSSTRIRTLRIGRILPSLQINSETGAPDQVDEQHGRQHGQDESTGTAQDEDPEEEADEGPGEAQQDRHTDAEGVRSREEHPRHGPHDQAHQQQAEDAE